MKHIAVLCLLLSACAPKSSDNWKATLNRNDFEEMKAAVVRNYADIVQLSYERSHISAEKLQREVQIFTSRPTPDSLAEARSAWIAAREPYGKTEVFRFYSGPIDEEERNLEPLLNAWPLDEAYIDYVEGDPLAGIINNPTLYPKIDKALLISLNERGGEKNIASGYHAIEFLLWGQDRDPNGPGSRTFSDYVPTEQNKYAERRAKYLRTASELIVEQIGELVEEWKPGKSNYRARFVDQKPEEALEKIMTGMMMLVADELMGERIGVAFDTQAQEEEQSCFSDTTLKDIKWNVEGVENVYLGEYSNVSGPGISHLVALKKPELDLQIKEQFLRTKRSIDRLGMSFDQAILDPQGRKGIENVLKQLGELNRGLNDAAKTLGLRVNVNA